MGVCGECVNVCVYACECVIVCVCECTIAYACACVHVCLCESVNVHVSDVSGLACMHVLFITSLSV